MSLFDLLFSPISDALKKPAAEERMLDSQGEVVTPESLRRATIERTRKTRAEAARVINETADLLGDSEMDLDLDELFGDVEEEAA